MFSKQFPPEAIDFTNKWKDCLRINIVFSNLLHCGQNPGFLPFPLNAQQERIQKCTKFDLVWLWFEDPLGVGGGGPHEPHLC